MSDLIPRLKPNYRIVLASNTTRAHFDAYTKQFADVLVSFDHLGTSFEARARKPEPAFFEHIQEHASAEPEECVFIDDLPTNVEAAERFGWNGIVYQPDGTLPDKLRALGVEVGTKRLDYYGRGRERPRRTVLPSCAGRTAADSHKTAMEFMDILQQADPEVFAAIAGERKRQQFGLEMIASENYTSSAVMAAQGSCLTNKYAEGYPSKRYYGGCEFVDVAEKLAIDRVKQLFGAEHANVQPHSGAQANMAVFLAALYPGDTILGLDLAHGGHLTHGMRLNFSGKYFNVVSYGVRKEDHRIDFDDLAKKAREHKPRMIIAGASAYPRFFDFGKFAEIAKEVGALLMVDMAHIAGLVAAKLHPDPVPHADFVTSTTHKTLRGPRAGFVLCRKAAVPNAFLSDEERSRKEPPAWDKRIDSAVFPGVQGGPLMHVIAGKAVAFGEALQPSFKTYAAQVIANAKILADELKAAGFSIVSGGTDNHLMLVDVTTKGVAGKQAEHALDAAGITVNKNMIPFDPRKPLDPSGIRIGTPALTTRGMKEAEMRQIATWITDVLTHTGDASVTARVKGSVVELCKQYPAPAEG